MPSVAQSAASGGNLTSLAVAFPNNLMSGSLILAAAGAGGVNFSSITDSQSNTYTEQIRNSGWGLNNNEWVNLYTATAQSGANTVTLAVSAGSNTGLIIMEISGVVTTGSTYFQNRGASGTTAKLAAAQNYTANQVLIASDRNEGAAIATIAVGWTATSGFTIGGGTGGVNQYQVPATGGSTDGAFGANDPGPWGICVAFLAQPVVAVFRESGPKRQYRREGRVR